MKFESSSVASRRGYIPRRKRRNLHVRRQWYQYETLASSSPSSSWTWSLAGQLSMTRTFGLVLFVLCIYVVYQMLPTEPRSRAGELTVGRRCPSKEFVEMLTHHSTPDNFIVLALVDTAFADMAINLYESSLRPNGIDNFLFVGAGHRACEILRNASLPCHRYTEDRATDVASTYQSPDFIRKMNIRTEMILDALSVGFTVLHTDLDVVFIRNPIPDLKVVLLSADLATMLDSVVHNAGFIVVRPTRYSRAVYERVKYITGISAKTDDQSALNTAIQYMNRMHKRHGFRALMLDKRKYLCGVDYFEKGNRLFPWKEQCTDCMVVHNNWIVSREAKIYRFKEHFMWMYDKDSYYSNASQRYLMYENKVIWPSLAVNDAEELAALKAALALGQMLSRVVILPRFHCSRSAADIGGVKAGSWTASSRTPRRRGHRRFTAVSTTSSKPRYECPLNCLLNVTAFDSQFEGLYRENSFLRHRLVSAAVSEDKSSPQHVRHRPQRFANEPGVRDNPLPATAVQLSVDDVVRQFGSLHQHVLVFQSLYRVKPRFHSVDEQRTFDDRVEKAFRRGTYRQL